MALTLLCLALIPSQELEGPLEATRILGPEDFARIKELRHKKLIEEAMVKHGLKQLNSKHKEAMAEEAAAQAERLARGNEYLSERKVHGDDLLVAIKRRKSKDERLESVMEGREGREFRSKTSIKQKKTGGRSNREKAKAKVMPLGARQAVGKKRIQERRNTSKRAKKKAFGQKKR